MADSEFVPLDFKTEETPSRRHEDWLRPLDEGPEEDGPQGFRAGLLLEDAASAAPAEEEVAPTPEEPEAPGRDEELERAREEARQEGYQAGLLEGREKGEEEGRAAMERVQSTFLDSFEQALQTLTEGQPEVATQWQEPLEQLVRSICERVLRRALDEDLSGYLERLVVAGLEALDSAGELRVTLGDVTPGLVEELRERLQQNNLVDSLRIHMEAEKPADFVRIETDYGVIQTSLESQLDRAVAEAGAGLAES